MDYDVLITHGKHVWRLHRGILCRESEWFAANLPPKNRVSQQTNTPPFFRINPNTPPHRTETP